MPTTIESRYHPKLPRYVKLAEELRRQIETGEYQPGDQMPSFMEMRTQHGVAQCMLERAYSMLEQDGLIERFTGRGTFVLEPKAKPLNYAVTLVLPMMEALRYRGHSDYFLPLLAGVQEGLQQSGFRLVVVDELSDIDFNQCDGLVIIVNPVSEFMGRIPPELPVVSVVQEIEGIPSVTSADADGIHQAVTHLLELGHRKIAYLTLGWRRSALLRLQSYRDTLGAAGIEAPESWIFQEDGPVLETPTESGEAMMNQWLREGWRELGCTALMVYNDGVAVGAVRALQEAGVRVPEDVSVVGFDSTAWCDYLTPPLTSVEVPLQQIGKAASEMLLGRIRGGQPHAEPEATESVVLPTRLAVRGSTRKPRLN